MKAAAQFCFTLERKMAAIFHDQFNESVPCPKNKISNQFSKFSAFT